MAQGVTADVAAIDAEVVDVDRPAAIPASQGRRVGRPLVVHIPGVTSDDNPAAAPPTELPVPGPFAPVSAVESSRLPITPPQRMALECLTSGSSVAAAATAAGVARGTLYRWLQEDADFAAAYNAWQHDALATARGRLLALTDTAVSTIGRAMANGNAQVALRVLERMGLTAPPKPGLTHAADIKRDQTLVRRRQSVARLKAEEAVKMEMLTLPDPAPDLD